MTVPRHRRPRSRSGVQFHESRQFDIAAAGAKVLDGLPVTGVARTILDSCSVVRSLPDRLDLFDEARRLKLVDWDDLWDCLVVHTGRGRKGIQRYRDVLLTRDSCWNPRACRRPSASIPLRTRKAPTFWTWRTWRRARWLSSASAGLDTTSSALSRPTPSAGTAFSSWVGS